MPEKTKINTQYTVKGARLSYPSIFKAQAFEEGQEAKFGASLILDKKTHAKDIAAIEQLIDEVAKDFFRGKVPPLKGVCLRDGSEKEDKDGYGGDVMFISASSKRRPQVVDRNPQIPLVEEDGKPYAGCYVNAVISLWVQDNKFGKRVNANLLAVQFLKDGEPFGERVDIGEAFGNEEGGEEADPLG